MIALPLCASLLGDVENAIFNVVFAEKGTCFGSVYSRSPMFVSCHSIESSFRTSELIDEDEGEVAVFSAKRWDRRSSKALIESATLCHDAQVAGPYWVSNPLRLTVLTAKSEDYKTAPQHLRSLSLIFLNSMFDDDENNNDDMDIVTIRLRCLTEALPSSR